MIQFHKDGSYSITTTLGKPQRPFVQWNHIDGPLLCRCDGTMHWLTWKERFLLWLGKIKVEDLDPVWDEELFGEKDR
jgi:hypothetical protein